MTFLWPEVLWLLLLVPVLVGAYFFVLKRKKQAALRYASLSVVKDAMSARQRLRRHIPPLLFLISMTAMIFAIALFTGFLPLLPSMAEEPFLEKMDLFEIGDHGYQRYR